jgi:hypothetical protein
VELFAVHDGADAETVGILDAKAVLIFLHNPRRREPSEFFGSSVSSKNSWPMEPLVLRVKGQKSSDLPIGGAFCFGANCGDVVSCIAKLLNNTLRHDLRLFRMHDQGRIMFAAFRYR